MTAPLIFLLLFEQISLQCQHHKQKHIICTVYSFLSNISVIVLSLLSYAPPFASPFPLSSWSFSIIKLNSIKKKSNMCDARESKDGKKEQANKQAGPCVFRLIVHLLPTFSLGCMHSFMCRSLLCGLFPSV